MTTTRMLGTCSHWLAVLVGAACFAACATGDDHGDFRDEAADIALSPSPGYYDSVDTSGSEALRRTLHEAIDDHKRFAYSSSSASRPDVWDILEAADQDPDDPGRVRDVYHNASYPKYNTGNPDYQREHVWPKSTGFAEDSSKNYPFTDCHHLFIARGDYNQARSNKPFDECSSSATCAEFITVENGGQGGGQGVYPGESNWSSRGDIDNGVWEVWTGRRGDIARAMFYMDLRYEGGAHGITGAQEPDLILTDDLSLLSSSPTNRDVAHMGRLSTLLKWHEEDPVSAEELYRNGVVASFQGNRNPFIDHPEWAGCIYLGRCGDTDGGGEPNPAARDPWFNEIHYDNAGSDVEEGVEIAGPAGLSLDGWSAVAYNGSGDAYLTVALGGALAAGNATGGALWFPVPGMQNGAADGLALVDPNGRVAHFVSYEGVLTALDGPAAGMQSQDIGVSEASAPPAGLSLQLVGTGCAYGDFRWEMQPQVHTRGALNAGQLMRCAP